MLHGVGCNVAGGGGGAVATRQRVFLAAFGRHSFHQKNDDKNQKEEAEFTNRISVDIDNDDTHTSCDNNPVN